MTIVDRVMRIAESSQQKADRDLIDLEIASAAAVEICNKLWTGETVPTTADIAAIVYRHMKGGL